MLEDPHTIDVFRAQYNIPANIEVRLDNPEDPFDDLVVHDGWVLFWLVTIVEGGFGSPFIRS